MTYRSDSDDYLTQTEGWAYPRRGEGRDGESHWVLRLDQLPAQPFLDDATQRQLIGAVQLADQFPDAGTAEEAQERLVLAFLPAIKRAARSSKVQDPEDALANALEEFLRAVRKYDLNGLAPFHASVSAHMRNHINDTDHESDLITIPSTTAERYWAVMHANDLNPEGAYAACTEGRGGMSAATFLAAHHVIGGVDSLEFVYRSGTGGASPEREGGDYDSNYGQGRVGEASSAAFAGPEERAVEADLVRWLFTLVSLRQALILKLRYGFLDDDVDAVRLAAGYPTGLDLSDLQVAHAIGASRPAVQREKTKALATMREAMQQLVNDEDVC